jgi:hypothetical protein
MGSHTAHLQWYARKLIIPGASLMSRFRLRLVTRRVDFADAIPVTGNNIKSWGSGEVSTSEPHQRAYHQHLTQTQYLTITSHIKPRNVRMGSLVVLITCLWVPNASWCSHGRHATEFTTLVPALVADAINVSTAVFLTLWILRSGFLEGTDPLPWVVRLRGKTDKDKK